MSSPHRQFLPEGLAQLPPGPRLGAALAEIDPARLTAADAQTYMTACHRQVACEQARFMEAMVWFGLCRPAPDEVVAHDLEPSPAASDEVRASLRWTRQTAERQFYLALDLRDRLPRVFEALREGRIDLPRARVLAEWTQELTPEQARRLCGALLPGAADLTTGELIAAVKQMAIAIDPDWAKRRYQQAVRTRRVVGHRNPDGTANLSGLDLPLDQTAAASARIQALARRAKNAGDGRQIDQIRADLFLGLLDGTFTGWDTDQIITHLTRHPAHEEQQPPAAAGSAQHPAAATTTPHPRPDGDTQPDNPTTPAQPTGTAQPRDADGTTKPGSEEPGSREPDSRGPGSERHHGREEQPGSGPGRKEAGGDQAGGVATTGADPRPPRQRPAAAAGGTRPERRAGVELRVRLSTLLGLDRHPAEIAGWGHTHAEHARQITSAQTGAQWCYALCDDHGALLHDGLITGRPHGYPARTPVHGIVEIQIPLSLLKALDHDPSRHPEWAHLITQITADSTIHAPDPDHSAPSEHGHQPQHRERAGPPTPRPPSHQPTTSDPSGTAHHRDRRFPTAPMRRSLQIRDRTCGFPGCRMPAHHSDLDHLRQWQAHGPTEEHNLTSLCRHDHRLKDEHGWKLTMTTDGTLHWTSRLGLTYTVARTPIIIDLPKPSYCRPAPAITTFDDSTEAESDETGIWADPEHPSGDTSTGKTLTGTTTKDRPPPLVDDEIPPF